MTSADNYGKTATLHLTGAADPTTDAAFSTEAPNRSTLGAPPAPRLPPLEGSRRRERISEFEAQNPGWTVDGTGRVVRAGTALR
jgi:hypothetical protein